MLDAIRAEALKLRRHRATWLMVWVYPIMLTVLVAIMLIYGAVKAPSPGAPATAAKWLQDSAILWKAPASGIGRFLIAGFVAVVFAGEYSWNTWKLIIPARARWQLICAKWIVAFLFIMVALIAADLIGLLGDWLQTFQGEAIPAGVTLAGVAQAHWVALSQALVPIVYTIMLAALFAVLTQSVLASAIVSIVLIVFEQLTPLLAIFAARYALMLTAGLVKVLPFFHLQNLSAWQKGQGLVLPLGPSVSVSASWGTSLTVLIAWIIAAGAVTLLRFQRQDLN